MIPSWFFESETVVVSFGLVSNGTFQSLLLNGHQEGDSSSVNNLAEKSECQRRVTLPHQVKAS